MPRRLTLLLVAVMATLLPAGGSHAAEARRRLVVLPLQIDPTAADRVPRIADELVLTAVHQLNRYDVIGAADVGDLLAQQKRADLLGCNDPRCFADISNLLAADYLMSSHVAILSDEWLVASKVIDLSSLRIEARSSEFIAGDARHLAAALPGLYARLFAPTPAKSDAGVSAAAAPAAPAPTAATRATAPTAATAATAAAPAPGGFQCRYDEPKDCEAQCQLGHQGSCYALAHMLEKGQGVTRNEAKAAALYSKLCAAHHAAGCSGLGIMYSHGRGGLPQDKAQAAELHARSCNAGDARGCYNLGTYYRLGSGGLAQDAAQALALYQKACDANDRYCGGLGALYREGFGVMRDSMKAQELLRRACDAGGLGCTSLGFMARDGEGMAKDACRAASYFERSCERDGQGCAPLGVLTTQGGCGAPNAARAVELFRRGCELDQGQACHNLARAYALGEGIAKDEENATRLFERGCSAGFADSCIILAERLSEGLGTPADQGRGRDILRRSCDQGSSKACERLAEWARDEAAPR